jgi:hypothetical protein
MYHEATAGPFLLAAIRHQTGHQRHCSTGVRVMGIIAWIVLGLGAGVVIDSALAASR